MLVRLGFDALGIKTEGGRPKKRSTIVTDTGRIEHHIIPLIGTRRIKDLTKTDINKVLKDIMAGKDAGF
jgi:Phage integrase, N-terminal SAM-like domain